ncbi:hypothetical protein HPC49_28830 [Pyxidicoccus fallax]|uniref:Uncharacterized protein n=1 Tax=Pyxidicoccus fallax TaxID=394095 RepID=A0A848L656_9BACT|nr:hypothetical protein [Pyxidicoccus fallax]NMO14209.1 hypothetical protein [Pyxidicoccus fallax]NPC82210.1 hypothetical protein [Pyxidicoccus fallax]
MGIEIVQLTSEAERSAGREAYEARRRDGSILWKVDLDFGDMSSSAFREAAIWADAGVAAIGGGSVVLLLDLSSGEEKRRICVPSCFGSLSLQRVEGAEWLFVLGWTDVHAFTPDLKEQWVSRDLAVDGIVGGTVEGSVLHVHAEMDPPGGWFSVQLDVRTGRELAREPAFTEE